MTCIVILHFAGCFSADHLHENGAVIGIQDGAEDDSRKHWAVCAQPKQISWTELWLSCKNGEMKTDLNTDQLLSKLKKLTKMSLYTAKLFSQLWPRRQLFSFKMAAMKKSKNLPAILVYLTMYYLDI